VGQTAHRFAALWPAAKIFSFEPVKQTYEDLTANTPKLTNVNTFNIALSDRQGNAPIFLAAKSVLATLEGPDSSPLTFSGETQTVQVDTLQSWCSSHGIERIDLLKVDTEGHDLKVLKGGAPLFERGSISAVFIETHLCGFKKKTFPGILEWLATYEFRLVAFYDQHVWIEKNIFFGNCLFLHSNLLRRA
jgi:FkbM family methyltransferase